MQESRLRHEGGRDRSLLQGRPAGDGGHRGRHDSFGGRTRGARRRNEDEEDTECGEETDDERAEKAASAHEPGGGAGAPLPGS